MNLNVIFFIGPQGSGKGTQAKLLAQKIDFFYWEMGGIIRQVAHEESEIGKKARELHDAGVLFPDDFLLEIFRYKMAEIPEGKGIIFDGIPRRLGQAEYLIDYLNKQGRNNFVTLFVNLPRQESLNRLIKRAQTENRPDDTPEKIEFRLQQYEHDTIPVLDFLKARGKFFEIDGQPPIEEVTKEINKQLGLSN